MKKRNKLLHDFTQNFSILSDNDFQKGEIYHTIIFKNKNRYENVQLNIESKWSQLIQGNSRRK